MEKTAATQDKPKKLTKRQKEEQARLEKFRQEHPKEQILSAIEDAVNIIDHGLFHLRYGNYCDTPNISIAMISGDIDVTYIERMEMALQILQSELYAQFPELLEED